MHIVITLQDIITVTLGSFLFSLFIFCKVADRQAKRKEKRKEKRKKNKRRIGKWDNI